MAKAPCPVSKTQFLEKAEPVKITIGSAELMADKREFSTGSFGWYYNGKTTITGRWKTARGTDWDEPDRGR
jgi:hypothetical protein